MACISSWMVKTHGDDKRTMAKKHCTMMIKARYVHAVQGDGNARSLRLGMQVVN